MKTTSRSLFIVLVVATMLLSACASGPKPTPASASISTTSPKVQAVEVAYTGVVERMDGNKWVVNSQAITVEPSVVQNGPYKVGDTIKLEGTVQPDGSILVTRVEMPSADDLSTLNTQASVSSMPLPSELIFNNGGDEAWGTVDSITDQTVTLNGQTFSFAPGAEIKGQVVAGSFVKVHFNIGADGTLTVREMELSDPSQVGSDDDDNGNDDDGNDDDGNDNGDDDNGDDDNGDDDNGDDDNGDDDNGNDDNGNDDDGNDNGDDDNGDDDNGDDDNGDDDNGDDDNGDDDNGDDDNGDDDNGNDDNGNDDNGNDD